MKIRRSLLFRGKRGSFAGSPEAFLLSFQRPGVGSRRAERLARTLDCTLGDLRFSRCLSFGSGQCFEPQSLAHAMKLVAGEILRSFEPAFEPPAFGVGTFASPRLGFGAPRSHALEGSLVVRCLPLGIAELSSAPLDLFAPKRHEGLERIALFHRRTYRAMPESNIAGSGRPFRARSP